MSTADEEALRSAYQQGRDNIDVERLTLAVHAWFCGEAVRHSPTVTPPACERGAASVLAHLEQDR